MQEKTFDQYYLCLLEQIKELVAQKLGKTKERIPEFSVDLTQSIINRLKRITLRTLIVEMKICDRCGLLGSGNIYERYDHYCQYCLADKDFCEEIYRNYPVLGDSLHHYIESTAESIAELVDRFEKDKRELGRRFFDTSNELSIWMIDGGSSDTHNDGRCVYVLLLSNGGKVVYKPRSLAIDEQYIRFMRLLYQKIGEPFWWSQVWNCNTYGWCEWVESIPCKNRDELERYYYRVGMLLCVGYVLGTSDVHYENLIAHGEYPVIIDLEMAIGNNRRRKDELENLSVTERVYQESVLHTGILPLYTCNDVGEGINVGAINGRGGQLVPIEVPVIVNAGTVNMKVEYRRPEIKEGKNLATINHEFVPPYEFLLDIQSGFAKMYQMLEKNQEEVSQLLMPFGEVQVRWLIRNTQQYSLALMALHHPKMQMSKQAYELIFREWRMPERFGSEEAKAQWRQREIAALLRGDIPYFTYKGEESLGIMRERLFQMSVVDLNRQQELIRKALFLGTKKTVGSHAVGQMSDSCLTDGELGAFRVAEKIGEILMENAIWSDDKNNVGWISMVMAGYGERGYLIRPVGPYLYDGIAGITLFVVELASRTGRDDFKYLAGTLKEKMFRHTEDFVSEKGTVLRATGAYCGEASIAYVYQLLFEKSGDIRYLQYMEKQCKALAAILRADNHFDLLSGNAGAIVVLLNAYDLTKDKQYIDWAELAGDRLIDSAVKYDWGYGWTTPLAEKALTGVAHGASGVMLALGRLGQYTQERRYIDAALEAFRFEEHYYHPEWEDWEDLRYSVASEMSQRAHLAWCHGKGGIALIRSALRRYGFPLPKEQLGAMELSQTVENEFCLCHGKMGTVAILAGTGYTEKAKIMKERAVKELCENTMDIHKTLTLQECENYGIMCGLSGIGYSCLCETNDLHKILLGELTIGGQGNTVEGQLLQSQV